MKRTAAALMLLLGLLTAATALGLAQQEATPQPQVGLPLATPITGGRAWAARDGAESAALRYRYPQFEAWLDADRAINAYYQALARDMDALETPVDADINFEVTHNDKRYISVVLTSTSMGGNGESASLSADTFARDGMYAGQLVTLSQVLGLEQDGGDLSDAASVTESLAYRLVWQIVERDSENADGDYLDGLTEAELRTAFSPETDFYLDEDGNVVFFIQAGEIAGEIAGVLRFPFAPAELLSAIKES